MGKKKPTQKIFTLVISPHPPLKKPQKISLANLPHI